MSIYMLQAQVYTQTRTCTDIFYARPAIWSTTAWQNTVSDDNKYISTKTVRGGTSWPIQFQKFGFNIPSNAVIQGIDVSMIRHKSGKTNVKDSYIGLVTGDSFENSYGNSPNQAKTANWTSTEAGVVYTFLPSGIGTDGYPFTWTPSLINKPYFGVFFDIAFSTGSGAVAYIEKIAITVRYTLSTTVANNLQLTPVNNTVIASADEKGLYNLVVRDLSGRTLQRAMLRDPENTTVYLANKLPGFYLISLEGNNSSKVIKAFVR
jgi:hypothetical protein